ncbi:MAG: hypothetical protein GTO41_13260 [Burkholderiales bacterium]|nr:hypothetical protein [Burkholderiales bacterium]
MSIRYYICDILAPDANWDCYRAAIAEHHISFASVLAHKSPTDGTPRHAWSACVVSTTDWTSVEADARCVLLFDAAEFNNASTVSDMIREMRGRTWGQLQAATRGRIASELARRGIPVTPQPNDVVFDVLQQIFISHDQDAFVERLGVFD